MNTFGRSNLENIKMIFEEKTGVELASAPPRHSVGRVLLLAAVLICLLTLTGYATAVSLGVDDVLKDFFRRGQEAPLSEGQNEYIDNHVATMGESVTRNGVTVTLKGAISDGTTAYILVDIAAPTEQEIETLALGFDVEFEKLNVSEKENAHISSISATCIPLADYDGQKNTASMLIQYNVYQLLGSDFSFTDGESRKLRLRDLGHHEEMYPYTRQTVAQGLWEYEFVLESVGNQEIELLTTPIAASYSQISGNRVDATITSVRAKGLSVTVYYTLESSEVQEAGDFGILEFIMKDGSTVYAYPEKAGQTAQIEDGNLLPGTQCHYCTYAFSAPVQQEGIAVFRIGEESIEVMLP